MTGHGFHADRSSDGDGEPVHSGQGVINGIGSCSSEGANLRPAALCRSAWYSEQDRQSGDLAGAGMDVIPVYRNWHELQKYKWRPF